jgi:16S rRNA (guanine966-N2)-methyltransferase
MRVIGGSAKGRRLAAVPGAGTRPITDRVKEALFNILGDLVEEARVLDLFAGTGAVGIEALSRGARQVVFVELSARATVVLRENLQHTGLQERARIVRRDVFRFLKGRAAAPFDLIYVAPPQYRGWWARALQALDGGPWLTASGVVVVQIHPKEYREIPLTTLRLAEQRKYGSTLLCFYETAGATSAAC